jgi:hypothetical protein
VVGDPAARPDDPRAEPRADPRGRPLPPGIELTTAGRDHYLQFVAGTDRSDTFHTQAMVWSQAMITDVLHGGDTRQLTDALGRAGRLDGAIAQAGFDYAWDQTAEQDRRNLDVARREARGNQGTATAVTSSAMIVVQAVMLV